MRRRALLSALAAGSAASLSGCVGFLEGLLEDADADGPESNADPSGPSARADPPLVGRDGNADAPGAWPDPSSDRGYGSYATAALRPTERRLSLYPSRFAIPQVDAGPFAAERPEGEVRVAAAFAAPATDDHPARLRAVLEADWRRPFAADPRTLLLRAVPLFAGGNLGPLRLAPTANHDLVPASGVPEYERGPHGGWRLRLSPRDAVPDRIEVVPGSRVHAEYRLLQGPTADRPVEPGRYGSRELRPWPGVDANRLTIAVWDGAAPGPPGRSAFRDRSVTALPGDGAVAWYHESGPGTPVFLRPGTERADLPARLPLELVNHSGRGLGGAGPPALYKLHGGAWFELRRGAARELTANLSVGGFPPGDVRSWSFAVFAGGGLPTATRTAPYVGAGTYAFVASVEDPPRTGGQTADAADRPRRYAALVELRGESVTVRPMPGVDHRREGDVVVVSERVVGVETVTVVAERVAAADAVVLAEQVMRGENDVLRNTLPFFEPGIERVRLTTTAGVVATALGGKPPYRFRFRGQAYRLFVENEGPASVTPR